MKPNMVYLDEVQRLHQTLPFTEILQRHDGSVLNPIWMYIYIYRIYVYIHTVNFSYSKNYFYTYLYIGISIFKVKYFSINCTD